MSTEPQKLGCPECSLPAGKIINGALVFQAKHHGQTHVCVVSLEWLKKVLSEHEGSVLELPRTREMPSG